MGERSGEAAADHRVAMHDGHAIGVGPEADRPAARTRELPRWGLYASEVPRALVGYQLSWLATPLLRSAPRGDGHPVLVLPGLLATDGSTVPLRKFLRRMGYHVHGWRLGRNIGPTPEAVRGLGARLEELAERHGRTISVVGWSLGGIYGREMARRRPDAVRQVITLGTPFAMWHSGQSRAHRTFQRFSHRHVARVVLPPPEAFRPPLPVPSTSIYSKLDGIVAWRACLQQVDDTHENVGVIGSHLGLGHNPAVLWVVADRLAQPEGGWRPFRAPALARALFPGA